MFKKIISIAVAMLVVIGCAINASALCESEEGRPGIVGLEYLDRIKMVDDAITNGEIEPEYEVTMGQAEGYWVVYLESYNDDGYVAVGFYDHAPTDEEFEVLWANRMTEDEFGNLVEELGIN